MTIETIDGVLYYVWRAGDELPKYQPIGCEYFSFRLNKWDDEIDAPKFWIEIVPRTKRRWPKLLNDRAQHQRMINEAFEKVTDATFEQAEDALLDRVVDLSTRNIKYSIDQLALCGALVKRMMEYVQAQIDKEGEKA